MTRLVSFQRNTLQNQGELAARLTPQLLSPHPSKITMNESAPPKKSSCTFCERNLLKTLALQQCWPLTYQWETFGPFFFTVLASSVRAENYESNTQHVRRRQEPQKRAVMSGATSVSKVSHWPDQWCGLWTLHQIKNSWVVSSPDR